MPFKIHPAGNLSGASRRGGRPPTGGRSTWYPRAGTASASPGPAGRSPATGERRGHERHYYDRLRMNDKFDFKYRVALAAVTALVLGDQVLVQPYLVRLTTDAPLINVAGRQRMLS